MFSAQEADVIIALLNSDSLRDFDANFGFIDKKKLIVVHSKSDLFEEAERIEMQQNETDFISTVTGEGIENLKAKIIDIALKK